MADQANPDNPEGQQELRQDELVDRLMPDPSQPQSLTVLSGFLGQSPQEGHWRLYLTLTLDKYVEIPEEDIVHSQSLGPEQSAVGGTIIWVRSTSPLQYTRITSHQIQAEFLQGAITRGFRTRAAGFPAGVVRPGYLAYPTHTRDCLSDACESDVAKYCPTKAGCFTQDDCAGGGGGSFGMCATDVCVSDLCNQSIAQLCR